MPELHQRIVSFEKYCKECEHFKKDETEEPCDHCLEEPVNTDTHRPVLFKQAEKKEKK